MPSGFSPSYQQRAVGHFPLHERDQRLQQMIAFARVRCPSAFLQFHSKRCRTPSSARTKPLFTTDDRMRKSTMPSGLSPSYQQRAVEHFPQHERDQRLQQMMTPEGVRCPLAIPPVTNNQRAVEHPPLHKRNHCLQRMIAFARVRCPSAFPQLPSRSC
jgi:hypothetical protein